ncbi:MAG: 50S ribosomal protein L19 [Candidatus Portnoybacteria bacterium]|nr:50S ribosomal protein L19 [Candidatus Portnoybacteria bacterium]MDD4982807.1 50S ribosomal protein L19 [Candidatus Portnoybacteria bacterium]
MTNIIQDQLKSVPVLKSGQTIRVHQRIKEGNKERIQPFEGLVIAVKHGRGLDGSFTVRKISEGVGVERIYPLHSPTIDKIEILKTAKVRQAKLYYMRERSGKRARMKSGAPLINDAVGLNSEAESRTEDQDSNFSATDKK